MDEDVVRARTDESQEIVAHGCSPTYNYLSANYLVTQEAKSATIFSSTCPYYCNDGFADACLILPVYASMFRKTRQANVVTSQLLHMQPTITQTCFGKERERHLRSKIRLFTYSCNSHYISQLPSFFNDARTQALPAE